MLNSRSVITWNYFAKLLIIACGYFILARVSLFLSFQTSNATPVWPPSGFALAMLLIFGTRMSPAIFLGAFAVNVLVFQQNNAASFSTSLWVSGLISCGNMLEAISGCYILNKLAHGTATNKYFKDTTNVFRFFLTTVLISMVSSTIGTTSVLSGNIISSHDYWITWLTWWLGDVSGILIITPFILLWRNFILSDDSGHRVQKKNIFLKLETLALFVCIVVISGIIFDNWFLNFFVFQWAYWIIPFVVWAALRFEPHETITAVFLCSLIAIRGTINGGGPFTSRGGSLFSLNDSLLILQAFVCILVMTTLILNASVKVRKRTEAKLRELSSELEQRVSKRTLELKDAAEKIEIVNKRLNEAQRLAHIGNWEWDIKNNQLSWSDELYRIFGLTPQTFEASYENYLKLIHPADRELVHQAVQQAYASHHPYNFYHRIVRPDGTVRTLHGHGEVLLNDQRKPSRMFGTAQDVTEIKQAEEEIKKLADDLLRYNKQLELTNKELESFTFVSSHDLQEPLRKIRTFLHLILEKESPVISTTSKDYIKRIIEAAERMQQLINDLLQYSRTMGSSNHFQKTDLNLLLEKVADELAEVLEEKNARIEFNALPHIHVIPFQFHQLFTNLITNALKFSRPGIPPHIVITAKKENNPEGNRKEDLMATHYFIIKISDNGIGFESEYKEKIFDLFQRLHNRKEYSGTGIGLSICKKIVENHGGYIEANSQAGKGATFTIYLPAEHYGGDSLS